MNKTIVWGLRWAPPFAQGHVRDLRVRWALEEAGIAYEARLIDFANRNSPSYLQIHPFGMVPAFQADGHTLIESGAILYRIAETCEKLMPSNPDGRAETLAWMFAALSTVEPPVLNLFAIDLQHKDEAWAEQRRPGAVEAVKTRLAALSAWLGERDYLLGRFTAADILMTTVLRFIQHTDLVAGFPVLDAYVKRCEGRPAFQKALSGQMAEYARNAPAAA